MSTKNNETKKSSRVVLIEDDDTMCNLITDFLDDEGYDFEVFNTIEDARGNIRPTDILIADVMIKTKRTAGVDFVLEVKKKIPEFSKKKVIFISHFGIEPVESGLQQMKGHYIWLGKPFDMLRLAEAIEEVKADG